ncbi:unnamed protein product [Enterobius vermicularis]|uniref:snRNA-activating protein complex subunit 4 n=1 Tax=Enterobius vermicularis TaxID=51028 RepID=A0A0N4V4S7_ENTVE|nr:unnamed protein product [Enterobius vermicularis]
MEILTLLALNEAYTESLENLIRNVQYAIAENKKRQEAINAVLGKAGSAGDFYGNKKKVPVNQFYPPYFRDRFGMVPPANIETQRKLHSGDYDPLVKPARKWLPKDLERLRHAVKREVAEERCAAEKKRRAEVQEMLKRSGQETSEEERTGYISEIESLTRFIEYTRNLSEEEIFGSEYDYAKVDWTKIATFDFMDTRNASQLRLKWINEQSPRWSKAKWTTDELAKLRELATGPWVRWEVVARRLGTARTPFQCFKKYKVEFDKELKTQWTREEDTALITLCHSMRTNGKIPWEKVYNYMEGRSRQQCKVRYARTLDAELRHGRWSEEEDILLKCAIGRFGKNWQQVASCVPGRSDAQCRDRWVNILDEKVKDSPWTLEEDEKLLKGVREIGKEWARIAVTLPGRTGDHCKSRFRSLMISKVKLCSQSYDDTPVKMIRRHDTTKHRRERRKAVEKHFKELLAADGQDEVAQKLTELFKTESLSVHDVAALADIPPEQRKILLELMQKSHIKNVGESSKPDVAAATKMLYNLLHENLSVRPEFLDNATRTVLYRMYEKTCLSKVTGRRPKVLLSNREKNAFLEGFESLRTEEDKKEFLMQHLVELMAKSDNADQCALQQQVTKNQCVFDLKYHLKEELIKEVGRCLEVGVTGSSEEARLKLNPLPPFAASIKILSKLKGMLPTLRSRAAWSFNKVEEVSDKLEGIKDRMEEEDSNEVHLQLSEEIKKCPQYIAFKMKVRSLLFWPLLMDRAIEPEADVAERHKLREIRTAVEVKEAEAGDVSGSAEVLSKIRSSASDSSLTIKDLLHLRRKNRYHMALTNQLFRTKADYSTEHRKRLRRTVDLPKNQPPQLSEDTSLNVHVRPESERLAMIDECIASVCQKVATEPLDDLLLDLDNSPKCDDDEDEEVIGDAIDDSETVVKTSLRGRKRRTR